MRFLSAAFSVCVLVFCPVLDRCQTGMCEETDRRDEIETTKENCWSRWKEKDQIRSISLHFVPICILQN